MFKDIIINGLLLQDTIQ